MRETFLRKTKMRESEFLDNVLHDLKIFNQYSILASPRMIEEIICPVGVCYNILQPFLRALLFAENGEAILREDHIARGRNARNFFAQNQNARIGISRYWGA